MSWEDPIVIRNHVLPNRVIRAATSECMGDADGTVTDAFASLLEAYACERPPALFVTGHIMVHSRWCAEKGNVIAGECSGLERLAAACPTRLIVQLNAAGPQQPFSVRGDCVGPSPTRAILGLKRPTALSTAQCRDIPGIFSEAARACIASGAAGVEVHAAHGYLLHSFLSPLRNVGRCDEYRGVSGGCLLLQEVLGAVREEIGDALLLLKLNASDFSRHGFTGDEAVSVVRSVSHLVDIVELSGGHYGTPAFMTRASDVAQAALQVVQQCQNVHFCVTGGVTRGEVADQLLKQGADLVGVSRAFILRPNLLEEFCVEAPALPVPFRWAPGIVKGGILLAYCQRRMRELSRGEIGEVPRQLSFWLSVYLLLLVTSGMVLRKRK